MELRVGVEVVCHHMLSNSKFLVNFTDMLSETCRNPRTRGNEIVHDPESSIAERRGVRWNQFWIFHFVSHCASVLCISASSLCTSE